MSLACRRFVPALLALSLIALARPGSGAAHAANVAPLGGAGAPSLAGARLAPIAPHTPEGGPLRAERLPAAPVTSVAAATLDGVWSEIGPLQDANHAAFCDPASGRLFFVGGNRGAAFAWPLAGGGEWALADASPAWSGVGSWWTTAHDPAGRVFYFVRLTGTGLVAFRYDIATGGAPETIAASGTPPELHQPSLAYDAARHRLLLLGGFDFAHSAPSQELWALDLTGAPAWSRMNPAGDGPAPRIGSAIVVDPAGDRLLVLGGIATSAGDSLWSLTLDGIPTWEVRTGPPIGANLALLPHGFVLDSAGGRLVTMNPQGDLWSYALAQDQWSPLLPANAGPAPRAHGAIALDATGHRLLLGGGDDFSGNVHSDLWALSLEPSLEWGSLVGEPVRPPVRGGASDGFDGSRNRLVVFGGSNELGGVRNDAWALDLGEAPTWAPVDASGAAPPPRYWHTSAYDPVRDQLAVFGGYGGDWNQPLADLWALSFASASPEWTAIVPAGDAPAGRFLSTMLYDSNRDRFLLLWGANSGTILPDIWELRLGPAPAWRRLDPTGTAPEPRAATMAVFDPVGDRVVLFGGGSNAGYYDDAWTLDFGSGDGSWHALSPGPGPSIRNFGLARLDPTRRRLLLFGGFGLTSDAGGPVITMLNDTWALSLDGTPAWTALSPAGALPPPRDRANGVFDVVRDRFVLACGGMNTNDTWTLGFGGQPTPVQISLAAVDVTPERARLVWGPATPGQWATVHRRAAGAGWIARAAIAADGDGDLTYVDTGITAGDTYDYRLGIGPAGAEEFTGETRVQVPERAASLSLAARSAGGGVTFALRLASGGAARLALFDLTGRRVWARDLGALGPGEHEVTTNELRLSPALYFGRLEQDGDTRLVKVVVSP